MKIIWLLFIFLLSACSENQNDLQHYLATIKARPAANHPFTLPMLTLLVVPHSLRNPFKASRKYYPLSTYRFVGTLKHQAQIWALIKEPVGTISTVAVGATLGINHGRVVSITSKQLVIQERNSEGSVHKTHLDIEPSN